jgi:hypothetical protein
VPPKTAAKEAHPKAKETPPKPAAKESTPKAKEAPPKANTPKAKEAAPKAKEAAPKAPAKEAPPKAAAKESTRKAPAAATTLTPTTPAKGTKNQNDDSQEGSAAKKARVDPTTPGTPSSSTSASSGLGSIDVCKLLEERGIDIAELLKKPKVTVGGAPKVTIDSPNVASAEEADDDLSLEELERLADEVSAQVLRVRLLRHTQVQRSMGSWSLLQKRGALNFMVGVFPAF